MSPSTVNTKLLLHLILLYLSYFTTHFTQDTKYLGWEEGGNKRVLNSDVATLLEKFVSFFLQHCK